MIEKLIVKMIMIAAILSTNFVCNDGYGLGYFTSIFG